MTDKCAMQPATGATTDAIVGATTDAIVDRQQVFNAPMTRTTDTPRDDAAGLLLERIREILEDDAPDKWVWKTHESQDEWIRGKLLPLIRDCRTALASRTVPAGGVKVLDDLVMAAAAAYGWLLDNLREGDVAGAKVLGDLARAIHAHDSALSAQPQPAQVDGWRATHRHVKTGGEYMLLGIGKMQAANWIIDHSDEPFGAKVDMREVAIYRDADGDLWVRPREEFEDGRFEALPTAPTPAQAEGRRDMSSAPKDGTHILALIFREACHDMDDVRRPAFAEVKEVFYKPYVQFGMNLPWHSGDPFDSHEGMAPEHMGEAVPIGWLPRNTLPAAPVKGGE